MLVFVAWMSDECSDKLAICTIISCAGFNVQYIMPRQQVLYIKCFIFYQYLYYFEVLLFFVLIVLHPSIFMDSSFPSIYDLTLCLLGNILSSADFVQINFLEQFVQEYHQCQSVWNQIRPDILSGLIRV